MTSLSTSPSSTDMSSETVAGAFPCRFCGTNLRHVVVDLGMSPLCESYVPADRLNDMEPFYPLKVFVCHECWLVQLDEFVSAAEIFTEYAYFSSYADSWVAHAKAYVDMITDRLALNSKSLVVELASNDGYLLQHFANHQVPVLGVEPAANVAQTAIDKGIPTEVCFFGVEAARRMATEGKMADLICGNNVWAQVPDINDFTAGITILLKPDGVMTLEWPHLMRLMAENQFDTIYHEHFSYFSLVTAQTILARHGLRLFDVEELSTHGGSLRVYACHDANATLTMTDRCQKLLDAEVADGFLTLDRYAQFDEQVKATKRKLLSFLISAAEAGHRVVGYGAPGKGNTLLNYCGIRSDLIEFTVDRNPYKQGKFLPGTHIPIYAPDRIREARPDYVVILPWNFKDEIIAQNAFIREWGGKFVVPIPEVAVIP